MITVPKHNYEIKQGSSSVFLTQLANEARVLKYLNKLADYHAETFEHSLRVGLLSVDLGLGNGLGTGLLRNLGYAALLHDVGKLEVPRDILDKTSFLCEDERAVIERHPRLDSDIVNEFGPSIKQVIVQHHEYQRESYPRRKVERRGVNRGVDRREAFNEIDTLAQMLAVCDVYDALRSERAYKQGKRREEVRNILAEDYIGNADYIAQVLAR